MNGNLFIFIGIILIIMEVIVNFLSLANIPLFPGDIYLKRDNFTLYLPITSAIIISIVLSLIFNLFNKK